MHETDRRRFFEAAAASLVVTGLGSQVLAGQKDSPAGIPTRSFGKTGQRVSIVGLGGYHISNDIAVGLRTPFEEAERIKKRFGVASARFLGSDDVISVPSVGGRRPRERRPPPEHTPARSWARCCHRAG